MVTIRVGASQILVLRIGIRKNVSILIGVMMADFTLLVPRPLPAVHLFGKCLGVYIAVIIPFMQHSTTLVHLPALSRHEEQVSSLVTVLVGSLHDGHGEQQESNTGR